MTYILIGIFIINILWLLLLTGFVMYSMGKGMIVVNNNQVLDKETSIKLAHKLEEQMKEQTNQFGGDY